jgi:hypothetical protein
MVLPWNQDTRYQLRRFREQLQPPCKRILVVVADPESEELDAIKVLVAPIKVLPWSRRADLTSFVINDIPD